jgi:hypothetical protein
MVGSFRLLKVTAEETDSMRKIVYPAASVRHAGSRRAFARSATMLGISLAFSGLDIINRADKATYAVAAFAMVAAFYFASQWLDIYAKEESARRY